MVLWVVGAAINVFGSILINGGTVIRPAFGQTYMSHLQSSSYGQ